jgi:hypothetical protein
MFYMPLSCRCVSLLFVYCVNFLHVIAVTMYVLGLECLVMDIKTCTLFLLVSVYKVMFSVLIQQTPALKQSDGLDSSGD